MSKAVRLTVLELADRLRKKPSTISRWARTGRVPARKHGRDWTFDLELVERCLNATSCNKTEKGMLRK